MINQQPVQEQRAVGIVVPAPIDGLNYKDMLSNMAPTYALIMENVFPKYGGCYIRKGCQEWGV